MTLTLVDGFVLAGMGGVVPAACPPLRAHGWAAVVLLLLPALLLPQGVASALLAAPTFAGAVAVARSPWSAPGPVGEHGRRSVPGAQVAMAVFLLVAAGAVVAHARGRPVAGIHDPIIELTAVHFTFAGVGAFALALAAREHATGRPRHLAGAAVVLSLGAPPVVALGFLTSEGLPQIGGAVLMTLAVWATAIAQVVARPGGVARWCLGGSSAAVAVAMPLAVAWAAGQHWNVPALSVQDMARTHGLLNGLVFVPAGLLGWHLAGKGSAGAGPAERDREHTG